MNENYFMELNSVNVNDKIEKKNGLSYLSWAFAWGEVKKRYPDSTYTVYENNDGWNYFTDGKTCWVKTGVTVNGLEHIEYLPVMDFRNKSIPANAVTSFDVNKAIQRSLTKAIARHGLGLYIYAGEDLPSEDDGQGLSQSAPQKRQGVTPPPTVLTPSQTEEFEALKKEVQGYIDQGLMNNNWQARYFELVASKNLEGVKGCADYMRKEAAKAK